MNQERAIRIIKHFIEFGITKQQSAPTSDSPDFNEFRKTMIDNGLMEGDIRTSNSHENYGEILDLVFKKITPLGKEFIDKQNS